MSNDTFVQQRAYIYAPNPEDIKKMEESTDGKKEFIIADEKEDDARGVVVIDILGE